MPSHRRPRYACALSAIGYASRMALETDAAPPISTPSSAAEPALRITPALVRVSQIALAILVLLRIGLDISVPPIGDEAYYWMWGQKLGWSYLDHPPLHAWLLHVVGLVFGWNLFSLRALTWFTLGGSLYILWLWSRR